MKKLLVLCLIGLLLFGCISCGSNTGTNENIQTNDATTESMTEADVYKTFQINGIDISNFVIVYDNNPLHDSYENIANISYEYFQTYSSGSYSITKKLAEEFSDVLKEQTTEFDLESATYFQEKCKEMTGIELPIILDTALTTQEHCIQIGKTNKGDGVKELIKYTANEDYVVSVLDKDLVICGNTYGATYQGVEAFFEEVSKQKNIALEKTYKKYGKASFINIACIGDSITFGSRSTKAGGNDDRNIYNSPTIKYNSLIAQFSYPAVLGRLLWKEALVYNFARGATTMSDITSAANYPAYKSCAAYTSGLKKKLANMDIAFIMLGTNDGWGGLSNFKTNEGKQNYNNGYLSLIQALEEGNSNLKMVLMTCPYTYRSSEKEADLEVIRSYQREIVKSTPKVSLFEMATYTKNNLTINDFTQDTLHPNDRGYYKIALGVLEYYKTLY